VRSLSSSPSLAKQLKQAQSIRASGDRLLRLIDDILDMSRIEAGAMRFERAPFDPRRLTVETTESLAEPAAKKSLELKVQIAPDVARQTLGDALRIRQVLTNLISNAIKFTANGRIDVSLSSRPAEPAMNSSRSILQWSVSDTGIGIPERAREYLFQPFSQIDDSPTRSFGGTGLGLAICRQIVTALGGNIEVESTPGSGSTFRFEIPLEQPPPAVSAQQSALGDPKATLKGRVLVVEDNETNSDLIVEMLKLAGCEPVTATNGVDALDKLERERFDAVLMDWHMPQLDGLAATRLLRDRERLHPEQRRLPVIALTASVLSGDREACLQAGMDAFIPKPFTYDQLFAVLCRWLPVSPPKT
jgi:CheY-like chemotaxis protein/two-component sensor histidine kinase